MSNCKLDHSIEDVRKKLDEQTPFLPTDLVTELTAFLEKDLSQQCLNELFHLLKKYDLSSKEEQNVRNEKLKALIK
ncbi:hypothetical protein ACJ2A9_04275 [Anaerobacillus sp. MEB173]|uniref:hypothetical protein n=1 Tax=Anaerobacillus sp. MEB173 TaxID=3383345 RepID=UPI003F923822